jgi:hypothetical protein
LESHPATRGIRVKTIWRGASGVLLAPQSTVSSNIVVIRALEVLRRERMSGLGKWHVYRPKGGVGPNITVADEEIDHKISTSSVRDGIFVSQGGYFAGTGTEGTNISRVK